jgi:hypothetical protein
VESLILMLTHQSVRAGISDVSGLGLFAVRDFQTDEPILGKLQRRRLKR